MRNYWSCSKFADWIRGTPKPPAETMEGWEEWKKIAKTTHRIRYWIAEEGLDHIQKIVRWIPDKIYAVRYYFNNRFITKTHCLTATPEHIKRGKWMDVSDRIMYCLFDELVNFVECELAINNYRWDKKAREKFKPSFFKRIAGLRSWRSREAGLDYLNWAMSLKLDDQWISKDDPDYGKPTRQAIASKEIYDLYIWWTETRANRPDAMDASGWSEYCEKSRQHGGFLDRTDKLPDDLKKLKTESFEKLDQIERTYEEEDEEMLIRLIKVRGHLWT